MALHAPSIQERRKFPRRDGAGRLSINLLRPQGAVSADGMNVSEAGVCVRLEEMLEVRSLIRLQFATPPRESQRKPRLLECAGRVAWVIQRSDLRERPPFLFDIGIEFVDPPPTLRKLLAQRSSRLGAPAVRLSQTSTVEPVSIRSRAFVPRLERESNHPLRWHLVVSVDGVPCFSGRYASERAALEAWGRFKRQQARR